MTSHQSVIIDKFYETPGQLTDSSITVVTGGPISVQNVIMSTSQSSSLLYLASSTTASVRSSELTSTGSSPLIGLNSPNFVLDGVTMHALGAAYAIESSEPTTLSFSANHTSITASVGVLKVTTLGNARFDYSNISMGISSSDVINGEALSASSSLEFTNSNLTASNYFTQRLPLISNDLVLGISIKTSNVYGLNIIGPDFCKFVDSNFYDTDMNFTRSIEMDRVNITQETTRASVEVSVGATFTDVIFTNPSGFPEAAWIFRSTHGKVPALTYVTPSYFSVSNMHIADATRVSINNLTLTGNLTGASSSDSSIYAAPSLSITTWRFHSIDVTNVFADIQFVNLFEYYASQPGKGISGALPSSPPLTRVIWPGPGEPALHTLYPIATIQGQARNITLPTYRANPSTDYWFDVKFVNAPTLVFERLVSTNCVAPPPTGFQCAIDGTIYATGNVDLPSLTLPPQAGTVSIDGNLTISTPITFVGTDTTLNVSGCVTAPGIVVQLQPGQTLPKGRYTVLTQNDTCPEINLQVTLTNNKRGAGSCEKVTSKQDTTAPKNQLALLFTLDKSQCNVKWIILGSVLGSVLLILLILTLVFTLNPKARACIRPFSVREAQKST